MDLSIFTTPEAWISLVTLIFLEIILGVDNIVFIVITTDRLPVNKQHIGRKLGLAGAFIMRSLFLCFASFLVHLVDPLFSIDLGFYAHGFSIRDLVLFAGGVYLIYKGVSEMRSMFTLNDLVPGEVADPDNPTRKISLPQAIATIMVMDIVFSIDSVITAVGMANHLIIMILAVMIAIILMMVFIDTISKFINSNPAIKLLALSFIVMIGILLTLDGLGINSGIEVLDMHMEKLMVYFAMVFSIFTTMLGISYRRKAVGYLKEEHPELMYVPADDDSDEDGGQLHIKDVKSEQAAVSGGTQ
ncbi:TerC family protein [Slackia heliotrinireducens]|uniref:TerC family protein n=1 Tax=Slackia heliotrinireducens TaxID=84110 RepID=UPI003314A7BB